MCRKYRSKTVRGTTRIRGDELTEVPLVYVGKYKRLKGRAEEDRIKGGSIVVKVHKHSRLFFGYGRGILTHKK